VPVAVTGTTVALKVVGRPSEAGLGETVRLVVVCVEFTTAITGADVLAP